MSNYLKNHLETKVPQTEQADPLQVPNSAGGFSFKVTLIDKLRRFLILGSEDGTYYIGERDLTKQNLDNLKYLTNTDPRAVVDLAGEISEEGRSYRNDACIFALAYVMTNADPKSKEYARSKLGRVVRPATHLFQFELYLKALATGSGLGTSRNRAIADWYGNQTPEQIAYQAVKYRQRQGWTHRDSLRQSRPKFHTDLYNDVAKWILGKYEGNIDQLPEVIQDFEEVQKATDVKQVLRILDKGTLPWEALPTNFHKSPEVWQKLFYSGQLKGQALVRNITRLAKLNCFDDMVFAHDYANALTDVEMIRRTRLHPLNFLNAFVVYTQGQIQRDTQRVITYGYPGSRFKNWNASAVIQDALDAGVKLSFRQLEPTGKRTLLAVDVSGSMSYSIGMGLDLTAAQVSGVMAATIAKTEPYYQIMGFAHEFRDLGITANMDLNAVMRRVQDNNFGGTDCALPMLWAQKNNVQVDTFVVITDNETWAGRAHPYLALRDYRKKMGIDSRLVVVGVTATDLSIADPNDPGMLDVAGADANLPKLIAEFSKRNI